MSKGYTLNYFINLFNNTTTSDWKGRSVFDFVETKRGVRATALENFIGYGVISNVDLGSKQTNVLGKTPRARILKALYNRKRHGNVFGKRV
jgi:hypothetical protein